MWIDNIRISSAWFILGDWESKENLTDSCERSTECYIDINDSTAFGRGSDDHNGVNVNKEAPEMNTGSTGSLVAIACN